MPSGPFYDAPASHYDAGLFYAEASGSSTNKPKNMAKLRVNIARKSAAEVVTLATTVHGQIAPAAPATPPIPNLTARATALATKTAAAQDAIDAYEASKATTANLKQARDAAVDDLRDEIRTCAGAVEVECGGDPVMLSASGFELADTPTATTTPPAKVLNLAITAGDADGSVDGTYDPQEGISIYEVQCTTVDPITGPWTTVLQPTASSFSLSGLTSGQRCWFRVRAINVVGAGAWSDPATKIVP